MVTNFAVFRFMKLIGLPVFTEQGDRVGTIVDLEYDENNQIKIYHVRRVGLAGFIKKEILIHPSSVVSIDEERMIVKGTEIKEPVIKIKEVLVSG